MTDEKRAELHDRDLAVIREYKALVDAPFAGHKFAVGQEVKVGCEMYFVTTRHLTEFMGSLQRSYSLGRTDRPDDPARFLHEDALEAC